jgi:hypothetical protein
VGLSACQALEVQEYMAETVMLEGAKTQGKDFGRMSEQ